MATCIGQPTRRVPHPPVRPHRRLHQLIHVPGRHLHMQIIASATQLRLAAPVRLVTF